MLASARAWAKVRGFHQLDETIGDFMQTASSPEGYVGLTNKPPELYILMTWPWAPERLSHYRMLPP